MSIYGFLMGAGLLLIILGLCVAFCGLNRIDEHDEHEDA